MGFQYDRTEGYAAPRRKVSGSTFGPVAALIWDTNTTLMRDALSRNDGFIDRLLVSPRTVGVWRRQRDTLGMPLVANLWASIGSIL